MKKVQVGFIGAGAFVSAHHLLTVRDSEIMEIRAIADLNEETLAKHAANMQVGYTTTDYTKLLADPGIDMLIVGTKQELHARFIVECLDAGKWVYCEKPMAETDEETEAVLDAEKRNPGKLAIGFNRRFAPACRDAKRLMAKAGSPRPWFLNYRLMWANPQKRTGYYSTRHHILYEGCHILDLVCWLLESAPKRVFMTGDEHFNNCCILDFPDGSQVSFMCGTMSSLGMWKEYMEIFADWSAITVRDFISMTVRGIPGEHDRLYAPQMGEHAEEIEKFGFDFYDAYRANQFLKDKDTLKEEYNMDIVPVKFPVDVPFNSEDYGPENTDLYSFIPDKGWIPAVEQFARCLLDGTEPDNADGKAGALATHIAEALIKSLKTGQPVEL